MLIAQITDLHVGVMGQKVYGLVDTPGFLAAAIAHLNRLNPQPDLVIATGDLVDEGTVAEYQTLADLLAPLRAPLYLALGNHDDRDAFRQIFGDLPYVPAEGVLQYAVEDYPVRLLVLDTLVPGASHGELDADRLAWLEQQLAAQPHRPTVICMHHPPFVTGLPGMDKLFCRGAEPLAALVSQYPAVERILCGHLHRPIQLRWAGTLGSIAPSVAHQVALRFPPARENAFVMEPPAFQLHLWHPQAGLVTHTAYVGNFDAYSYATKAPIAL
ncbi:phosphodiesterase [Leptolyngbya sp. PCC 6406]|uniref:phosphodiesterase n=1 Tax=Leptolyngbya sp. PCC 6406 TaxID=1173264 RepID=UPI0002AC4FC6|nr:phosphodiesterase [Leptolyngbya sp. PCC 6406]